MIEPTDEMGSALLRALPADARWGWKAEDAKAWLADVLAIVARDHCLERRGHVFHPLAKDRPPCGVAGPDGLTCERHPHQRGRHAALTDDELVHW